MNYIHQVVLLAVVPLHRQAPAHRRQVSCIRRVLVAPHHRQVLRVAVAQVNYIPLVQVLLVVQARHRAVVQVPLQARRRRAVAPLNYIP